MVAGGAGGSSPPLFFYLNIFFADALVDISNCCNLYYMSYIEKKTLRSVLGAIFCLLLLSQKHLTSVYCVVRAFSLHSPTFALRSLATARFDLGCACETATGSPRVKKIWSALRKLHTTPEPLLLFARCFL